MTRAERNVALLRLNELLLHRLRRDLTEAEKDELIVRLLGHMKDGGDRREQSVSRDVRRDAGSNGAVRYPGPGTRVYVGFAVVDQALRR